MFAISLPSSLLAVGTALLLTVCVGCTPSPFNQGDLQAAGEFVKNRLQATYENAQGSLAGTTVYWTHGPQVAAGSDFVTVYGEFDTVRSDGFARHYTCNAKLRRKDGQWGAVQMKVREEAPRTPAQRVR